MRTWALILAAGQGKRLASAGGAPKQFMEWRARPLYWHSALAFSRASVIDGVVFVFPQWALERERARITELARLDDFGLEWRAAAGGAERRDSSRLGLAAAPADCAKILIHDAARCFLRPATILEVWRALGPDAPAVAPALPVSDTIKQIADPDSDLVAATPPRACLRAVQTPQGFDAATLRRAHEAALASSLDFTDDAMLFERLGMPVKIVPGDSKNKKITNPEDLRLLEDVQGSPCCGFGYDAHRFGGAGPLKLGGVAIPNAQGLAAHSDGDVLLHALMDAMLGCAALGDIGCHFPDSDPKLAGISSAILLDHCLALLRRAHVELRHVDLTVVAQTPKLAPHRDAIRRNVARLLGLAQAAVNFKATTEEGMGFTGAGEGIKAYAMASGVRYA